MTRIWPLAVACLLTLFIGAQATQASEPDLPLWRFDTPGDIGGFQSSPTNGATNQLSWVGSPSFEGGGALKIDYTGSSGYNTAVTTSTIPALPPNVATISAQVSVPAEITSARLELGIQIDGTPPATDVVTEALNVRGGWNAVSWAVHPGQLNGGHKITFVLRTDDPMPAPLYLDDVRAVQPHVTVDATKILSTFDPVMLWGSNVAYYYPPSFFQDPIPIHLAQDAGYYFFRIPGGLNSDVYHWNSNGARKPDGTINRAARRPDGTWTIDYSGYAPGFEVKGEASTGDPLFTSGPNFTKLNTFDHTPPVDAAALGHWIMSLGPQAQIMVDVNAGTASSLVATGPNNSLQESDLATGAQEAAGWVRYYNQQQHLHVKYWEVGNELNPYGAEIGSHIRDSSAQGWHWITAADYATIFRAYARAMKAVDPSIQMAGPVGYLSAFGDASGRTSWIQTFLQQAGDVVDVVDIHFYNHGENEAQTMARPNDLQPEIDKMRGWLRQSASQRANQVAFGVSEWGNYNNSYPIGDGLYAADLMGQMAESQLAYGAAWDIGNVIPDTGQLLPSLGFDSVNHLAPGWSTQPSNGSTNALSWANDPNYARPGHWSLVVDYKGSSGANAALGRDLAGVKMNPGVNSLQVDALIPSYQGNNTIIFWLRIERADGSFDDSGREQPQQPMWGEWNRILLPLDPAKLAGA
ncbi:MAG TPA: hypothetical protein VKU60_06535, partial [Chloroflexota bacterium]|nr:hypothetical protein [Chloroflexota bacterium]